MKDITSNNRSSKRSPDELPTDERAVSITLEHAMGVLILLTITGPLIFGLMDANKARSDAVTKQELNRISDEVAAGLLTTDSLMNRAESYNQVSGGNNANAATRLNLPDNINGDGYSIRITENGVITVESNGIKVTRNVDLHYKVITSGKPGGPLIIKTVPDGANSYKIKLVHP